MTKTHTDTYIHYSRGRRRSHGCMPAVSNLATNVSAPHLYLSRRRPNIRKMFLPLICIYLSRGATGDRARRRATTFLRLASFAGVNSVFSLPAACKLTPLVALGRQIHHGCISGGISYTGGDFGSASKGQVNSYNLATKSHIHGESERDSLEEGGVTVMYITNVMVWWTTGVVYSMSLMFKSRVCVCFRT